MRRLALVLASACGAGFSPWAPGTAGAFVGALVLLLFPGLGGTALLGAVTLGFAAGVWAAGEAEKVWGHDARRIVIDEVVGMWVVMLWVPRRWELLAAGFVLCRVYDILKPFPAGRSQSLPGGWGVMVDDLLAGIYGNLTLQLVLKAGLWT